MSSSGRDGQGAGGVPTCDQQSLVVKVWHAPLPHQGRNATITSSCLSAGLRSEKQVLALENEGTAGAGVYEDGSSEGKEGSSHGWFLTPSCKRPRETPPERG